jgi:hypothetical protein
MVDQIKKIGWHTVEAGLLLIVLCVVLNIIIGQENGSYISFVAENATKFVQSLPAGVTTGIAMVALLYWFAKTRAR